MRDRYFTFKINMIAPADMEPAQAADYINTKLDVNQAPKQPGVLRFRPVELEEASGGWAHSRYLPVMIAKRWLTDGNYYAGVCRNAHVARWDAATNQFYHWREKFGHRFIEAINHPDDEQQYDVFIPLADISRDFGAEITIPQPRKEEP